jgi:hypothetical protein
MGGFRMKIPVLFLLKIRECLPEFLRQELDEIMQNCREAHRNEVKKCREFRKNEAEISREAHSEAHSEAHTGKNGEISSKTAFSAQNCEAHNSRGGEGGVLLNNSTLHNTVTEDDVTGTISLKEKNIKKRKENCEAHRNFYSPEFEEFHKIYPNKEGKLKAFEAWKKWKRVGTLPSAEYLAACVEMFRESDKWLAEGGRFIPMIDTFVRGRRWEALSEQKIAARINSKKAKETKPTAIAADDPLNRFEAQEKAADVAFLMLPPLAVWKATDYNRKVEFADRLGFTPGDISREIEKRMQEAK